MYATPLHTGTILQSIEVKLRLRNEKNSTDNKRHMKSMMSFNCKLIFNWENDQAEEDNVKKIYLNVFELFVRTLNQS